LSGDFSSGQAPFGDTPKAGRKISAADYEKAVKYAVSLGLDSMYVTEDTTRCDPKMVKNLYSTAIRYGARAIVICDTAGHATPMGTFALVRFVIDEVVKRRAKRFASTGMGIATGLGTANAMAALWPARSVCMLRLWGWRTGGKYADGPDAGDLKLMASRPGQSRILLVSRLLRGRFARYRHSDPG